MTTRGANQRPPRRRGRTRWLLTTPVVGLTLIIAFVVMIEALAPTVETSDQRVEGIPPLVSTDERPCTRQTSEGIAEELRDGFPRAGRVSSTQVFLCPRAYNELRVTFVGEVVGEVLPRAGGAWAQVNDDAYALEVGPLVGHRERDGSNSGLPVWLPDDLHRQIEGPGRAGRRGDVVLVRGTLLQADPDDGGGLTIRAEELEVLAEPMEVEDPLHVPQLIAAIVLALLAFVSIIWSRRSARRA